MFLLYSLVVKSWVSKRLPIIGTRGRSMLLVRSMKYKSVLINGTLREREMKAKCSESKPKHLYFNIKRMRTWNCIIRFKANANRNDPLICSYYEIILWAGFIASHVVRYGTQKSHWRKPIRRVYLCVILNRQYKLLNRSIINRVFILTSTLSCQTSGNQIENARIYILSYILSPLAFITNKNQKENKSC